MHTEPADELSHSEIESLVETAERDAWRSLVALAPAPFRERMELATVDIGAATAIVLGAVDHSQFNRVVGLGVGVPATASDVDRAVTLYESAGVSNFLVHVSPGPASSDLPTLLAARGLDRVSNWAKVYRGTAPAPHVPTDLAVERVSADEAEEYGATVCAAFGMPPVLAEWNAAAVGAPGWTQYVARDGERAVAVGSLYVAGAVGWLGIGATLPSHRCRGAQGALMARRIDDALAAGCRWIVTETGEDLPDRPNPSLHNMYRTGFRLAYLRPNYKLKQA